MVQVNILERTPERTHISSSMSEYQQTKLKAKNQASFNLSEHLQI